MHGQWTDDPTRRGATGRPRGRRGPTREAVGTRPGERRRRGTAGAAPVSAPGRSSRGRAGGAPARWTGCSPARCLALVCGGYAAGAALGWGSQELALFMGDFGLSAAASLAAVSCFLYARSRAAARPPRLAALLALLGDGRLRQRGLGLVRGGARRAGARAPPSPTCSSCCSRRPPSSGLLVLAKRPVTRAGWVCLGLDAWLIGGSLLTLSWSLALARTAHVADRDAWPQAALSLAYPLLDIVLVSMVLALHFRRSAANRSAVNTAIAALALTVLCDALFTSPLLREQLPLGAAARRRLVRRLAAAGLRALGRAADRPDERRRRPRGRRAPPAGPSPARWPRSRRTSPPPSAPWGSSTTSSSGRRVDRVVRLHRLHGRARPGRPPGHHARRQHRAHPGTGPEGEPLPLPGAGLQRRHHDRRAHRDTALRQPGRRRGLRARRRGAGRHRARLAHPPRGPGPGASTRCAGSWPPRPPRSPRPGSSAASGPAPATGSTWSPPSTATRAA